MSNSIPEGHGTTESTANAPESKKEKALNIVTMEDGTQANFGSRNKVLSAIDLATKDITFRVADGTIINWVPKETDNLSPFQLTVFLYGLLERVKTGLSSTKSLSKVAEVINAQIGTIDKGEFNIRSISSTGAIELTLLQKAYALAMAGVEGGNPNWANVDNSEAIEQVLAVWENKTPVERNAIRRHPLVQTQINILELAAGKAMESLTSM